VAVARKQGTVLLGAVQDTDPVEWWVWSSSAMTTSGPRPVSHESLARMSWWEWAV